MRKEYLRLDDDIVLINNYLYPRVIKVDGMKGIVHSINSTGIKILSLCDGMHTFKDIVKEIATFYKVKKSIVENDAKIFLDDKYKKGLIKLTSQCKKKDIDIRGKEHIILPYQLSIETTNQCQLKCKHCYNSSGEKRENELTTIELINVLKQYRDLGGISVMLTGGEIFLKEDIIDLIDYVATHFLRVVILTNGFFLSEEILKKIVQYKDCLAIQVSLDGLCENHDFVRGVQGAYEASVNNIQRMVNGGVSVSVACTLNGHNSNDIYALTEKVKEIGCASINIGAVASIGRADGNNLSSVEIIRNLKDIVSKVRSQFEDEHFLVGENIEEYAEENVVIAGEEYQNKCGAGYKILHLFSNGKIGLCPSHGSIIDKFWIGDLRKNTFEEILSYENMKQVLNIPNPSKKLCADCELYEECAQCIVTMLNRSPDVCELKRKKINEKIINM